MMYNGGSGSLVGVDIHGFRTLEVLDVQNMVEEAKSRWLRPNEINAILCNHTYIPIYVKPANLLKKLKLLGYIFGFCFHVLDERYISKMLGTMEKDDKFS